MMSRFVRTNSCSSKEKVQINFEIIHQRKGKQFAKLQLMHYVHTICAKERLLPSGIKHVSCTF